MLLCQVALGKMHECTVATKLSADTLPAGTHSTKGCGQTVPDPKGKENETMKRNERFAFRTFSHRRQRSRADGSRRQRQSALQCAALQ